MTKVKFKESGEVFDLISKCPKQGCVIRDKDGNKYRGVNYRQLEVVK